MGAPAIWKLMHSGLLHQFGCCLAISESVSFFLEKKRDEQIHFFSNFGADFFFVSKLLQTSILDLTGLASDLGTQLGTDANLCG